MVCSHYLMRGRLLRENGRFLPRHSFQMRKQLFNDDETGYFKQTQSRPANVQNPITDPSMMTDMLKSMFLVVIVTAKQKTAREKGQIGRVRHGLIHGGKGPG